MCKRRLLILPNIKRIYNHLGVTPQDGVMMCLQNSVRRTCFANREGGHGIKIVKPSPKKRIQLLACYISCC